MCWSQPLIDGGNEDGRLVADGELVIPRGDRAVPFEAIDAALDRVALAVVDHVELRRTSTAGAALLAVGDLVALLGNRALDFASPRVGGVRTGALRLVRADLVRLRARTPWPEPGHPDAAEHGLKLRGVAALSGRDDHGQHLLGLLNGQVQLGGQSAARPPETVVVGFPEDAAGRLG